MLHELVSIQLNCLGSEDPGVRHLDVGVESFMGKLGDVSCQMGEAVFFEIVDIGVDVFCWGDIRIEISEIALD